MDVGTFHLLYAVYWSLWRVQTY